MGKKLGLGGKRELQKKGKGSRGCRVGRDRAAIQERNAIGFPLAISVDIKSKV